MSQRQWQQLKMHAFQPYWCLLVSYGCLCCVLCVLRRFVVRFGDLLSRVAASTEPVTLAVVGGGAGGVELALALAYRLKQERAKPGVPHPKQPDTVQ